MEATKIISTIDWEVSSDAACAPITVKQYDKGSRYIVATITNNGEALEIASSAVVAANFKRADGQAKAFKGTILTDGTVQVPIPYWATKIPGTAMASVSFYGTADERATTLHIPIRVQVAEYDDDEISDDDEAAILTELLSNVAEFNETVVAAETARDEQEVKRAENEAQRKAGEATRANAEEKRLANETARVDAESDRANAEAARVKAETDRVSAETDRVTAEVARAEAENSRVSTETTREANEAERKSAETTRATNEANRVSAETDRAAAEVERQATVTAYSKIIYDGYGLSLSATLLASGWDSNKQQTVSCPSIKNNDCVLISSPTLDENFYAADLRGIADSSTGTITLQAATVPTVDLTIDIFVVRGRSVSDE